MFVLHFALVGVFLLVLGPHAVFSLFNSITFSAVEQCGNFSIYFSGGKLPAALPLTLTVVPFDSTPISIVLPASAWDNSTATGAAVNFLPLAAGVEFVASLDDARGVGTGLVSDVIQVQSSNDSTCLHQNETTRHYVVGDDLQQCAPFNVTYNSTVDSVPTIRGFVPRGASFAVNQTESDDQPGTATYIMDVFRELQTVLLLSNNATGYRETTALLAIGGDSMSSTSCIPLFVPNATTTASSMEAIKSKSKGLTKGDIIAIAVVPGTIALAIIVVVAVLLYRRRKARMTRMANMRNGSWEIVESPDVEGPPVSFARGDAEDLQDLPSSTAWDQKESPQLFTPMADIREDGADTARFVKNPLYTDPDMSFVSMSSFSPSNSIASSLVLSVHSSSSSARGCLASSAPFAVSLPSNPRAFRNSDGVKRSLSRRRSSRSRVAPTSPTSSISTTDIEHILDMATMYSADAIENPNLPLPPPLPVQDTARTSAYFAGRQSIPVSFSFSVERDSLRQPAMPTLHQPTGPSPLTNTIAESAASPVRSTQLVTVHTRRASTPLTYREPPTAPLPTSPLPSPMLSPLHGGLRPPNDSDGDLRLSTSSAMYSVDFAPGTLQSFQLVSPPGGPQRDSLQV
ncbi:hypothetical protein BKA93DRAFT_824638 [Sparassis latifolia]